MKEFFSSLYVHIPFCIKKCNYCKFYSLPYDKETAILFLSAILKEINLTKELSTFLKTIYIGGGTPTCLSTKQFEKLLKAIRDNFNLAQDVEFTIENTPNTITKEKINLLKLYGINRISLGIQSFLNSELLLLGRNYNAQDAIKAIDLFLNIGFENVSIDLIYGIPDQTLDTFKFSLEMAVSLDIKHISIYELSIEKGTPLEKKLKKGTLALLKENDIAQMYLMATEFFEEKGFNKYEISNFAKRNFECKHNMNYWLNKPYLGLGPSACSYLSNKRFHNPSDIFLYLQLLQKNKLPWIFDYEVDRLDELKERIILGLRMKNGIILDKPCLINFFKDLEDFGYTRVNSNKISLTDKGMLLANEIFVKVLLHIENCSACKQA
jgi:oxygen-independent coproporphyrinogen-3 oxidase